MTPKYILAATLALAAPCASGAVYGPYPAEQYTLIPPVGHSNGNAIVAIHGGGFVAGSRNQANIQQASQALAQAGFTVYVIDYRLLYGGTNFPAPVQDVQIAVRYVRSLGYKGVGVLGTSAGGELALFAGALGDKLMLSAGTDPMGETGMLTQYSSRPDVVVSISGPVDQTVYEADRPGKTGTLRLEQGLSVSGLAADRLVSPITYVTKAMPPVLIMGGVDGDPIGVDQQQELDSALTFLGVPHSYQIYYGQHVLNGIPLAAQQACLAEAARFALYKRPVLFDKACAGPVVSGDQ